MKLPVVLCVILMDLLCLSRVMGQTFVIDSLTRSPSSVTSGGLVEVTVRVRNTGPGSGQLRSVRVIAAPVPPPLSAVPTTRTFNPPVTLAANQIRDVVLMVAMPVLNNCVTTWSFGFDVTVDAGSGTFTRSFTGAGNNVTVTPFCPDLTAPVPTGWDREVVVSNTFDATRTTGVVQLTLPIYVSAYVRNLGGPTPAGVPCTLLVRRTSDRVVVYTTSQILPPMASQETNTSFRNTIVPPASLRACDNYEALILIDPDNIVLESNNGNNQYSSPSVFVNSPQSIQSQPTSQSACAGSSVSFRVTVNSGGAEVFFRWKKNGVVIPISGPGGNPSAATNTLVLTNIQPLDGGSYSCAISNACEALTSQSAILSVLTTAPIQQQPQDDSACPGSPAVFSVLASGPGPLSYQWQWRIGPSADWINVREGLNTDPQGGTVAFVASTVRTSSVTIDPSRSVGTFARWEHRCVVTNGCGDASTRAAALTVCAADTNCDGFLDFFDYNAFVLAFEAGGLEADFNGDGFLDFFDYDSFVTAFEAGC